MKEVFIDNCLADEGLALLVKHSRDKRQLRIATMASESCKDMLAKFVLQHKTFFSRHILISTSGTANHIRSHTNLHVESVGHGPDGGDVIIAYKILRRELEMVLFFRSGKEISPHEEDIRMLFRIANMSNCVLATNLATASLTVIAFEMLFQSAQLSDGGDEVHEDVVQASRH